MRFMLVWESATTLPTVMVRMATMPSTTSQSALMAMRPTRKSLNMTTSPIFLEPAASSADIGGGRSLVYVGGPHVERRDGDLEAEARDEEG